jgi:predicted MFS family arabinose efflux permease
MAFGGLLAQISQVSLRQAIAPKRLQGRMNATMRVLGLGLIPVGALLGGLLGEAIGLRPTLLIAAIGDLAAVAWLWSSAVRTVQTIEEPALGSVLKPALASGSAD